MEKGRLWWVHQQARGRSLFHLPREAFPVYLIQFDSNRSFHLPPFFAKTAIQQHRPHHYQTQRRASHQGGCGGLGQPGGKRHCPQSSITPAAGGHFSPLMVVWKLCAWILLPMQEEMPGRASAWPEAYYAEKKATLLLITLLFTPLYQWYNVSSVDPRCRTFDLISWLLHVNDSAQPERA